MTLIKDCCKIRAPNQCVWALLRFQFSHWFEATVFLGSSQFCDKNLSIKWKRSKLGVDL